jgi:hypothetical protein
LETTPPTTGTHKALSEGLANNEYSSRNS